MTPDPSPLRPVRLVFGVHSHQPIGNFDSVFEKALRDAYDPFLDALERHPSITAVVHYSGCLCEWLEAHAPGHLDRLAALARAGRVELLTGAFYEPILSLLPRTDAVGQIRLQTRYIRERFGAEPRGMWLAERIWEPTLPGILQEAGVDFTLLDDYHFLGSLDEDPGGGYYLTEDQGHVVRLFPISQPLRYLTPFREPEEAIRLLRTMGVSALPEGPDPVAVIVDDGEKFGLWPGTHDWVHGAGGRAGWLDRFFGAVAENAAWLKTSTFEQVLATVPARGRVYLPPGSYFEMGEWALPKGRGRAFAAVVESSRSRGAWDAEKPFLRGGFFRNFLAKYPESHLLLRRAQAISRQLDRDERRSPLDREGSPSQARRELWRATCNCGYWHGIFGGLYLPHIRRAIATHLCRAGRLMDADAREPSGASSPARAWTRVQDVVADGGLDVAIETARLSLLVDPADGGAIRVLDVKARDFPLASTLTRRIEIYHDDVLRPARRDPASSGRGSIHEAAAEATDAMRELVVADDRTRASAVDRFLDRSAEPADLARGAAVELGDFFNGRYELEKPEEARAAGAGAAASIVLNREGRAAGRSITLRKTIRAGGPFDLELEYRLLGPHEAGLPDEAMPLFAVEFNLALIEALGRIEHDGEAGRPTARALSEVFRTGPLGRLSVAESYAGFTIGWSMEPAASVWHYPVRTVSRSEQGFETIYQGSCLLFVWGQDSRLPRAARIGMTVTPDGRGGV